MTTNGTITIAQRDSVPDVPDANYVRLYVENGELYLISSDGVRQRICSEPVVSDVPDVPDVPVSGLLAWYDASDATTLFTDTAQTIAAAEGDPIAVWLDKSGNDYHILQTTQVHQPVRIGDSLRTDGAGDLLRYIFSQPLSGTVGLYVVFENYVHQGTNAVVAELFNHTQLAVAADGTTIQAIFGGPANLTGQATNGVRMGGLKINMANGDTTMYWGSNTSAGTRGAATSVDRYSFAARINGTSSAQLDVKAVLVYNGTYDEQSVFDYLSGKYGVDTP